MKTKINLSQLTCNKWMVHFSLLLCLGLFFSQNIWAQENNVPATNAPVSNAPAATTPAAPAADAGGGFLMNLPVLIAMFALFYFLMIRPQRQQQKKHTDFISSLKPGDEIITQSGIIGTIRGLTEKVATLEISPDSEIKILKSQIQAYLKDILQGPTTAEKKA